MRSLAGIGASRSILPKLQEMNTRVAVFSTFTVKTPTERLRNGDRQGSK
jgi:hypothetical protein